MTEVDETRLPGMGVRHDFSTDAGERVGLVTLRSGRRELVVYDRQDPDAAHLTLALTSEEASTLADLLGGTRLTERVSDLAQEIEGLAIEWIPVPADTSWLPRTIGDAEVRTRSGASVVAVLRGDTAITSPGPTTALEHGDTVVVAGSPESVEAATHLLLD